MKTLLSSEYNYKKKIADNLQSLVDKKYVEISDEEFERITTSIETYYNTLETGTISGSTGGSGSSSQNNNVQISEELLTELNQLRNDIDSIKPASYEVEDNGLYFVDENGYIGVKINGTGLYAINLDESGSTTGSSNTSVNSLSDLSDVTITNPQTGEALLYYANSSSWKNSTVTDGSVTGSIVLIDY